jgi:hypothetical protein
MIKLNLRPEERILRQFAWIAAIAFPVLAAWFVSKEIDWYRVWAWHWTSTPVLVLGGIGVGQLLLFLAGIRQVTHGLFVGLMIVAYPIGFVLSHVLIAFIYYVVITPIALVFRLIGRDVIGKKLDARATTYWRDRGEPRPASSYFKLY